jgi:hypothetical protein
MNADDKGNPRIIHDNDLERTLRYMEAIKEEYDLDEDVKHTLMLLKDCWPTASKRDIRGASFKQLKFVCQLAGFDVPKQSLLKRWGFALLQSLSGGRSST